MTRMAVLALALLVQGGGFTISNGEIVLTKGGSTDPLGFSVTPGPSMSKNMLRVFYK